MLVYIRDLITRALFYFIIFRYLHCCPVYSVSRGIQCVNHLSEKPTAHYNIQICYMIFMIFRNNNCHQHFILCNISLSPCCGGLPAPLGVLFFWYSGRFSCTLHLRPCHSSSIVFKSRLWQGHPRTFLLFPFCHSEVSLLFCFESLYYCITQQCFSSRSWTDE